MKFFNRLLTVFFAASLIAGQFASSAYAGPPISVPPPLSSTGIKNAGGAVNLDLSTVPTTGFGPLVRQYSPVIYGTPTFTGDINVYNTITVMYGRVKVAGQISGNFFSNLGTASYAWAGRAVMWSPIDGQVLAVPTTAANKSSFSADFHVTRGAAPTIASASTIAPTTSIVYVSGTAQINTITIPTQMVGVGGTITLIPTGLWSTGTSGNVALGSTAVVGKALIMTYDPTANKLYPSY